MQLIPKQKESNDKHIVFLDFDDTKNPLLNAGQAKATYEVGKRLATMGYRVSVISSRYPGFQDRIEDNIYYHHIGAYSHNIRFNNLAYIAALPFTVSKLKADIILECFTPPFSTLFSPLWTKIPVIAKPTSFEAERFAQLYHLPFPLIERFGSQFYRYFIPSTVFSQRKMEMYNPSVVSKIIPEGVDDVYFTIKRKNFSYILFLGRLDIGQKGIDLLLEAYRNFAKKLDLPLIIAGHGPDQNKISSLITRSGLDKKVWCVGSTYGEKKAKLLSQAACVALPSRHEGFCIFALEALAAGLPLVTFDIPGLSWTTTQVALKAKPFDTTEFAYLLSQVVNPALNRQMSTQAQKLARNYTWDTVTQLYCDFFNTVFAREHQKIQAIFEQKAWQ